MSNEWNHRWQDESEDAVRTDGPSRDPASLDRRRSVPQRVPSGLPVYE